jgi:hypothetical protein
MLTDSSQHRTDSLPSRVGFLTRIAEHLRQFVCGLHGHDALLHFDRGRISLLCTSCGYESPGWDVKEAPSGGGGARAESGHMRSLPLVGARRVA